MAEAARSLPLEGRIFGGNGVTMAPAAPAERIGLRAGDEARAAIGKAIGGALPKAIGKSTSKAGTTVMCIGPDEWLVVDDKARGLASKLDALDGVLLSAVDVSHRNTAIMISGELAAAALASGCPRDLRDAAFPVGACARTLLDKAEIVLLRTAPDAYRIECWRSFSDYVWKYLVDAAKSA